MRGHHGIGNIYEQPLRNATSTTLQQFRDMWKSPRGIVIRIQALALVAIAFSFCFVSFGSWRRWSNLWIVQKGVLAANVLSLSLGTYSIGLMQSSSVKSEMYPIWAVSMLTLLGCIDSSTAYGLDYLSQLSKMLSQLCLYCGYVLLISISSIASEVGYIAIGVLSAITFIKGLHRSLALVLPSNLRNTIRMIAHHMEKEALRMHHGHKDFGKKLISDWYYSPKDLTGYRYVVYWLFHKNTGNLIPEVTVDKIWQCRKGGLLEMSVHSWKDVCLSLSLSHLLQRRFFGLECAESKLPMTRDFVLEGLLLKEDGRVNYERAFKVIEVELAFLYDVFFTSNAFLHYYESKVASIWACASAVGICFVGVAAIIPGTRSARTSGDTIIVGTTTADLVITMVILVSLASLQVLQLLRCWTSNWARVALVCDYMRNDEQASYWMRKKAQLLHRINWFDNRPWQNKLGQYSLIESISTAECKFFRALGARLYQIYSLFLAMLGLHYIEQVLQELCGVRTNAVALHADVKEAIVDFLISSRESDHLKIGTFSFRGSNDVTWHSYCRGRDIVEVILKWHIATCYHELEHDSHYSSRELEAVAKNRGVATALSKYCAYLVVSAPQLLPAQQVYTKSIHDEVVSVARLILQGADDRLEAIKGTWSAVRGDETTNEALETMETILIGLNQYEAAEMIRRRRSGQTTERFLSRPSSGMVNAWEVAMARKEIGKHAQAHNGFRIFWQGLELGKWLESRPDSWEVLADFWVQALLFATPSGNVEEHMEHLAQGGEFITHVWALLSHAGILKQEWSGTTAAEV